MNRIYRWNGHILVPLALLASIAISQPRGAAFASSVDATTGGSGSGGSGTSENVVLSLTNAQAAMLISVSLDPEALTAAGLTPTQGKTVIDAGKEAIATHATALASAQAAIAQQRSEVHALSALVRSGMATGEQVTELATAKNALAAALADQSEALDAIWTGATVSLESGPKTVLSSVRANRAWGLPAPYLSVTREEADCVQLRNVLDQQKVCVDDGVALDGGCASFLATVEGDSTVAAALTGVATHHASLQASWDAALAGS